MSTCIALLRGVNVGGITVKSADLRDLFVDLGFEGVRTVLATGNVVFEASDRDAADASALKSRIERALGERFGYDAWIVLSTVDHVARVIDAFPFDADDATRQPWVIFGSDEQVLDELEAAAADLDPDADPVARGDGVVYWNPIKGTTTVTPFAKLLAKAKVKPSTTNRNLRTLRKMVG
ncbi:DUF1697 domain-containing protein [Agromyces sp. CFH 90414]|uniref:DUF1697 domain-containing protein n=1 Tax=Agromyces agglutinans TaxID=2662258 RepID=A0A6I2FBN2_9MICO|nr:DUF1697 domain-containing protein [Agromyces agglutinans]MRG58578.1 DUF1697 domain-containing protein [Agromyces agglutinans]